MPGRRRPRPGRVLLDVDGTILDVAATPQGVVVPASLVRTLRELHVQTNGALALVSGRLIEDLDRLFVPLKLPCVGGHGVERRISASAPTQRRHARLSPLLKTQVTAAVSPNGHWVLRSCRRIGFMFDGLSEMVSRLGIQLIRRSAVFHQSSYSQTQLRLSAETLGVIHDAPPK